MRRKVYQKLLEWKNNSNGRTAVLLDGARRVGKSYIVENFARENYRTYILIDFNKISQDVLDIFETYLDDLDSFFLYLSSYFNIPLFERESLIIFDEVQMFPRARAAIKYLVEDGRYDYIETGSLVSISENVLDIVIPSEEHHIKMYPLDFEEFLWALDDENIMNFINKCFTEKKPLGQALHRKVMNYFRQYLIVGGMPQAVNEYVSTHDFNAVNQIKMNILNLYRADIKKHAKNYALKVENIFDSIPSQLQKHEKKFRITSLGKDAKSRDYDHAMLWLVDAMIVNHCYRSTEPSVGLKLSGDGTAFKCYMADTGLLITHSFDENEIFSNEIYKKILFNKLDFNEGMIIENIVAQMLVAGGHKLYYYSSYSRLSAERMEIDFLISKKDITSKHNVSPIEVKSGKNYTLASLNKFINKYKQYLATAYVIHTGDLKVENDIVYLPIYMTSLL